MSIDADVLVKLVDVSVYYNDVCVLERVNLQVQRGDFLAVIGPNGGGKTTLLKTVLGLIRPAHGKILFPAWEGSTRSYTRTGYVPQVVLFEADFPVSAGQVVLMGRLAHRKYRRGYADIDEKQATAALETVDMVEFKDRPMGELSKGQQQRVFLARALAMEPELLLLDEPMANIDSPTRKGLYELLKELCQRIAVVLVTHDLGVLSLHVNKIACLNRQLYYHDSPEIEAEALEATYRCPVQLIAHGFPHRVLKEHT